MEPNTNSQTKGNYAVGKNKPPKHTQFGQPNGNPINRAGTWKKEMTARFKLEKMLVLTEAELIAINEDTNAPMFERKLAKCIMDGGWREISGIIDQVYGAPVQRNVTKMENVFDNLTPKELLAIGRATETFIPKGVASQ